MKKKQLPLVDDVNLFRHLGSTLLQRGGLEVHTAASGSEALEKARATLPDLIFLDFFMPDLNGDEVCREVKSETRTGHIPIVMLNSEGEKGAMNACLSAGCDDFVTKPIRSETLQETLSRHLNQRNGGIPGPG